MGYKHTLAKNIERILDRAVFIHNRVYLDYDGNEEEKIKALKDFEIMVKDLGENFEQYKMQKITIEKLDIAYTIGKERYLKIFMDYPWIGKFDLNTGFVKEYWAI